MSSNEDLSAIFDRIANGQETEGDMQTLRRLLRARDGQNVLQVGNNIVNIAEGRYIHIGDRTYYDNDAEAIKEALRSVLQEKKQLKRPRNEKLLLQAVKNEVFARLKQSLHNAVMINLGKEAQPEQVKRPGSSDIKIGDKPSEPIPDSTSFLEVFEKSEIAGKLLILGNPGAGKTTTMLDLAQALIIRAEQEGDYPIPVLFNLSTWKDDKQSMLDWLVVELESKYGVQKDIGTKWVSDAKLLPMLDGLDELESDRQELCVQKINAWLPQKIVVSSRQEDYQSLVNNYKTKLQLNGAICLRELNDTQIQKYLMNREDLWQTLLHNETLLKLMRKPLFLSITVLSGQNLLGFDWQHYSSEKALIEKLFDVFYEQMFKREISQNVKNLYETINYLQYLLDKYIRGKRVTRNSGQYIQENLPNKEQTKKWLVYLAKQLQYESQTEFLTGQIGFLIQNMQPSWLSTTYLINRYQILVGLCVVPIVFLLLLINILFGGQIIEIIIYIIGLLITGWGLSSFSRIEASIDIWQLVRQSIICALLSGTVIGTLSGLLLETVTNSSRMGWGYGLKFALITTFFCFLHTGGQACIQHFILRYILYRKGLIPWNYSHFLKYATERLFLQEIGNRYQFIHQLMRDYFAQQPSR